MKSVSPATTIARRMDNPYLDRFLFGTRSKTGLQIVDKKGAAAVAGNRAFAADASGYVRGEGCGALLLKPLSQALADGNRIYALLRGSAVNQDGRSNGLTAPNRLAQEAVVQAALSAAGEIGYPVVVKADGLAAGKGVIVCSTEKMAQDALKQIMVDREFGEAGDQVVVEECLVGEEASFLAFTDGKTVLPLPSSQDHKPVFDGDKGLNTGGMGAYSPAPVVDQYLHKRPITD